MNNFKDIGVIINNLILQIIQDFRTLLLIKIACNKKKIQNNEFLQLLFFILRTLSSEKEIYLKVRTICH